MINSINHSENNLHDPADILISSSLSIENPRSFFLFSGAGSGKTRSLIYALEHIKKTRAKALRINGQKIGVITYTNAACDEIKQRLDFCPLIEVSTIHSFVWQLIKNFSFDIKNWLSQNLNIEINDLLEKQRKGRAGTKAASDREISIASKSERLAKLENITRFTYSPNGENQDSDSLNHSEVIKIAAYFLTEKPLMKNILISKFPILLIDESQDTNKFLMESFLRVQLKSKEKFILGLFGDTMQRIYSDGKTDLGKDLPDDWIKPIKIINYRCPSRIIKLINKIKSNVDNHEQKSQLTNEEGFVHLFILPQGIQNKSEIEKKITIKMAHFTGDPLWHSPNGFNTLILEHHMAANRLGFLDMYKPLHEIDKFRTNLLEGSLSIIRLFSDLVLPIVKAKEKKDNFAIASIVRKKSPLLNKHFLNSDTQNKKEQLALAKNAVEILTSLWSDNPNPTFFDVLCRVHQTKLFKIPESLEIIATRQLYKEKVVAFNSEDNDEKTLELEAIEEFLSTPFSQIIPYTSYVSQKSNFDTHQGVKGREFPRVMVIIDDSEAKGFLFQYEKLFGAEEKTKTDLTNEYKGDETSIDRTRRLFYVACSRAEKSLAILAYSKNPQKVFEHVVAQNWFKPQEIELMESILDPINS